MLCYSAWMTQCWAKARSVVSNWQNAPLELKILAADITWENPCFRTSSHWQPYRMRISRRWFAPDFGLSTLVAKIGQLRFKGQRRCVKAECCQLSSPTTTCMGKGLWSVHTWLFPGSLAPIDVFLSEGAGLSKTLIGFEEHETVRCPILGYLCKPLKDIAYLRLLHKFLE